MTKPTKPRAKRKSDPPESKLWNAIKRRNKAKRTKANPAFVASAERELKAEAEAIANQLRGESVAEVMERMTPKVKPRAKVRRPAKFNSDNGWAHVDRRNGFNSSIYDEPSPKAMRKLAAWILRAADYLDAKEKG